MTTGIHRAGRGFFALLSLLLPSLLLMPPGVMAEGTGTRTTREIVLGMGCFWGAEKRMAALPGVLEVEAGYAGGDAAETDYAQVGALERKIRAGEVHARNHAEVVKLRFDPARISLEQVLIAFWTNHDPTQGNRQGNDVGSNYRSAIYYQTEAEKALALKTRDIYAEALRHAGHSAITTEIAPLRHYNRAEDYHQDYLVKNPDGYCGLGGTGVPWPETTLSHDCH
ncbi:MAG: peptide-methionine (S)-S-oxide reductase MsrA [Zoogloeaceae bacterium]|jgi:peptide methionine sulfoxide reductase msrA/msrB|nr:peptide-methionine (S)-S-oxide reductase MsrA [Zoogloeaceae bacterium]